MESGKIYGLQDDNGIILNGKYFECDLITELIGVVSNRVSERNAALITDAVAKKEIKTKIGEVNYTVKEVAKMLNKGRATITQHIRMGLLKATKPGGSKAWTISEENYQNYKNNIIV